MQPSEIFKDMDEAKAYAERMRSYLPADEYELFCTFWVFWKIEQSLKLFDCKNKR